MEIEFRGKINGGDWNYGFYVVQAGVHGILTDGEIEGCDLLFNEVDPATVGVFIGRRAANKNKIYAGDIIKRCITEKMLKYDLGCLYESEYIISWDNKKLRFRMDDMSGNWRCLVDFIDNNDVEIIGSIHDSPELMEAK